MKKVKMLWAREVLQRNNFCWLSFSTQPKMFISFDVARERETSCTSCINFFPSATFLQWNFPSKKHSFDFLPARFLFYRKKLLNTRNLKQDNCMRKTYVCDRQGLFFSLSIFAPCVSGAFLERVKTFISLLFVLKVCMWVCFVYRIDKVGRDC